LLFRMSAVGDQHEIRNFCWMWKAAGVAWYVQ
jgi:hypothetical protein